jgi:serine/threonine protein kinase
MALVGKSLDKLIEQAPNRRFSPGTAIGLSIQMVNALRALHQIGYLHRDIKPANTTIGRPEDNETGNVYLLDFGMARKFVREDVSFVFILTLSYNQYF